MAKSKPEKPSYDPSIVPAFYADQPAGLGMGPSVCRLTFGVADDDDNKFPRPFVSVVMPTASLVRMVGDLAVTLNSSDFRESMQRGLTESARIIAAGTTVHKGFGVSDAPVSAKKNKKKLAAIE